MSPRKSRIRGIAIEISRSRNSHIRARRSVTATPIGIPSRILNAAIDLRARRTLGRCPVIVPSCSVAASSGDAVREPSPIPMFRVIFSTRGASITVP